MVNYIGCLTTYQTRQFFNNSKTNEDTATRFEQEYVCCVINEKECVCSAPSCSCNILISGKIITELLGLVVSGTPDTKISWSVMGDSISSMCVFLFSAPRLLIVYCMMECTEFTRV